ncbi:hypothetical protein BD413DRAFT_607772 [Trametes elegans]|nr:hypothetical protein BD413DRAFT_607772 [Trametes elegans]
MTSEVGHSSDLGPSVRKAVNVSRINILPPEVISQIFRQLNIRRPASHELPYSILVSHVCSYWRSVALDCASLWSRIRIKRRINEERVATFLQRSKLTKLDVAIGCSGLEVNLRDVLPLLSPHARRIRSLSMIFGFEQIPLVRPFLEDLGSRLTTLDLTANENDGLRAEDDLREIVLKLDSSCLPKLEKLSASGVLINPSKTLLARLTSLALRDLSRFEVYSARPFLANYTNRILAACPQLKQLHLRDVFPRARDERGPFSFPELQELSLFDAHIPTTDILRWFALPPTVIVRSTFVWSRSRWDEWVEIDGMPPILRSVLPPPVLPGKLQNDVIPHANSHTLHLHAYDTTLEFWNGTCGPARATGRWEGTVAGLKGFEGTEIMHDCFAERAMRELPQIVDPTRLTVLDVHLAPHLRLTDRELVWPWLLSELGNVRRLTIGGTLAARTVLQELLTEEEWPTLLPQWVGRPRQGEPEDPPLPGPRRGPLEALTLCVHAVSGVLLSGLRSCAHEEKHSAARIAPGSLTIRLPAHLKGKAGACRALVDALPHGDALPRIDFVFKTCQCQERMGRKDWEALVQEGKRAPQVSLKRRLAALPWPFPREKP